MLYVGRLRSSREEISENMEVESSLAVRSGVVFRSSKAFSDGGVGDTEEC